MRVHFLQIYYAFAAGYLLSYLFRTVNAVISPELVRDLALNPSSLGLLTSAYFLAFAAMQIPVGMLLDRFGPRRVEPVLLAIAAVGALLFAHAESLAGLAFARALIGAGSCACLMAPLKALSTWYPPEKQASYAGWIMVAGGVGALLATTPVELALGMTNWRTLFVILGLITLMVAGAIWWRVPDLPQAGEPEPVALLFAGVRRVFVHPRFWWIAPLASVAMGSFMAIQGLWAVPWLIGVEGETRAGAAEHLLLMSGVVIVVYVVLGFFGAQLARRGVHARHIFAVGFSCNVLAFAMITLRVPGGYLWWPLFGLGAATNVLSFSVLSEGFGRGLTGRANTTLNLLMFGGSFVAQWGIGVIVGVMQAAFAFDEAGGLRVAFAVILVVDALALAWFAHGWRRHRLAAPESAVG